LRRFLLCCFFSTLLLLSKSQTVRTPLSVIYTRVNTYSSIHKDAFSSIGNKAALAGNQNFSAGIYGERRFVLQDLSSYQLAVALPTGSGNFGLNTNYFGGPSYHESQFGLAYGRSLGKLDVGVQFNYFMFGTAGYENASAINFEGGAMLHVSDRFQTGIQFYNPTGTTIGKTGGEKLPAAYSFGLGYDVSEKFFIGTEIGKTEDQPVNINAGMQYAFDERLFARTGIATATSSFYVGLGFLIADFRIDATASLHQSLGITPGLMIIYNSQKKKQ
jgi:hypothetical protein